MPKILFLLCPTDSLESIINKNFDGENYFYTSLGNSFFADRATRLGINEIVKKHHIKHIYFVLSNDNRIILDALGGQNFSDIRGLDRFYKEIITQMENSAFLTQNNDLQLIVMSYFLSKKAKKLRSSLAINSHFSINIKGKFT